MADIVLPQQTLTTSIKNWWVGIIKARISLQNRLSGKQKADIRAYAEQVAHSQTADNIRRFLKIVCVALHQKYGFGHDRLTVLMDEITKLAEDQKQDCVFWSHVDRAVIEELNLPFVPEDYDLMGE